ncbi:MAG: arsenate reductase (glutaredoxin) [Bacteroidales bacterium]|jgi:arsenate reductase|nr:arsenate reductase (glutaredoxin) [Bacteroidales bacterium]
MYKIYHNPRCKKSRAGLQYLQEKGIDPEVREYLKVLLVEDELKDLLVRLHKKPLDIVRTQEEYYRKELKGKKFTDDEWVKIMIGNPKLIQRPIVVKGPKAVIGDPASNIDVLL